MCYACLFCGVLCCADLCFSVFQAPSPSAVVGESLVSSGFDALHDFLASCEFIVVPIRYFKHVCFQTFPFPAGAEHTREGAGSAGEVSRLYMIPMNPLHSFSFQYAL